MGEGLEGDVHSPFSYPPSTTPHLPLHPCSQLPLPPPLQPSPAALTTPHPSPPPPFHSHLPLHFPPQLLLPRPQPQHPQLQPLQPHGHPALLWRFKSRHYTAALGGGVGAELRGLGMVMYILLYIITISIDWHADWCHQRMACRHTRMTTPTLISSSPLTPHHPIPLLDKQSLIASSPAAPSRARAW